MSWLARLAVGAMYPGGPFSRRFMALETIRLLLQVTGHDCMLLRQQNNVSLHFEQAMWPSGPKQYLSCEICKATWRPRCTPSSPRHLWYGLLPRLMSFDIVSGISWAGPNFVTSR